MAYRLLEAVRVLLGPVPVASARPTLALIIREKPYGVYLSYEWIKTGALQEVIDGYPSIDFFDGQEYVIVVETEYEQRDI
jgi:hypothetical protein